MIHFPRNFYALFVLFLLFSCKKESEVISYDTVNFKKKVDDQDCQDPRESKTYHTDTAYKYEYRTGESGNYRYHYDVVGSNGSGEKVSGEVDMIGKYGVGKITDSIAIEAEWIDKGEIRATDTEGNGYELIVQ
jgi:hypothetical protein